MFYVQVHYYLYDGSTKTQLADYGVKPFILPAVTSNLGTGNIVRYGMATSLFTTWGAQFNIQAGNCMRVAAEGPGANFANFFPGCSDTVNLATGQVLVLENTFNGWVLVVPRMGSSTESYSSLQTWLSGGSRNSYLYDVPELRINPYDSSGSTTGNLNILYVSETSTDPVTGVISITKFSSIRYRGVRSTDNTINLQTVTLNTEQGVYLDFFSNVNQYIPGGSTDPYDDLPTPGDEPIPGGGSVSIPGFPGLTATSAGVIGLFAPTAAQMQLLADFMWTDFGGTGTTVEDILKEVVEALKRSISNPLDYIIGLNIIPSQGLSIGASKVVRFGFISSGVSMPLLGNQYFTVDCGSLSFDTVCGDTFLDYAPYSKFSIYLPYIGFKDVDPNDFVGHTIGVVYHGDCVTGGVTAYITKDGTVMYQYSGCCALNVPLSADNWGETISAAINVATGIVAAAATGGAAGLAQGALKGAASVAANPSLLSPQVSHSGAVSGGAGCMGVQYPFVIREAVNFHSTAGFNKSSGYPAYYYKQLSEVTGFTTVIDAHMSGIPMATQDEIQEIESLLESGVIL